MAWEGQCGRSAPAWEVQPRRKKNLRAPWALRIQLAQQGQIWEDLGAGFTLRSSWVPKLIGKEGEVLFLSYRYFS